MHHVVLVAVVDGDGDEVEDPLSLHLAQVTEVVLDVAEAVHFEEVRDDAEVVLQDEEVLEVQDVWMP